jgi:hypothetical protein
MERLGGKDWSDNADGMARVIVLIMGRGNKWLLKLVERKGMCENLRLLTE